VFPVRYELNSLLFRGNLVFEGLTAFTLFNGTFNTYII
jgi:hypothetical protein